MKFGPGLMDLTEVTRRDTPLPMRFLGLLLFTLSSATGAYAADERVVLREFARHYESHEISGRHCGKNIDSFIDRLRRIGALPPDLRRVVIRSPDSGWHMESMLIGTNSRFGTPDKDGPIVSMWYFHVVALWQGKVYDFSFDREPRVLPVEEYLEAMFVPVRPFLLFGESFRIRGKGPYYGREDAREEVAKFTFEIERPTSPTRNDPEAKYDNLDAFLRGEGL